MAAALLLPDSRSDLPFTTSTYPGLEGNKATLHTAFTVSNVPVPFRHLMLAMAMLESNTLSGRDCSKDGCQDGSANVSIFNLSHDLVRSLGFTGDINTLDDPCRLAVVVSLVYYSGVCVWGTKRLLDYVRGGRTAFSDGCSYGAAAYRDTIATIMHELDADHSLMYDDRRVNVPLEHV